MIRISNKEFRDYLKSNKDEFNIYLRLELKGSGFKISDDELKDIIIYLLGLDYVILDINSNDLSIELNDSNFNDGDSSLSDFFFYGDR